MASRLEYSPYSLGINREVFVFGGQAVAEKILHEISSLNFLVPVSTKDIFLNRSQSHIIIAPCDFFDENSVEVVMRCLRRVDNPLAHKIIYNTSDRLPKIEHLLYCFALGVGLFAFGKEKNTKLRDYLKRTVLYKKELLALEDIKIKLEEVIKHKNRFGVKPLYHQLMSMPKDQMEVLRLLVEANELVGDDKKTLFYLHQMLNLNKQELWAINKLAQLYLDSKQHRKGLLQVQRLTEIGSCLPISTGDGAKDSTLSCLDGFKFPPVMLNFISTYAKLLCSSEHVDEGIAFFNFAFNGLSKGEDVRKAKIKYNMGIAYLEDNNITKAKECFEQSKELGKGEFNKANQQLYWIENGKFNNLS